MSRRRSGFTFVEILTSMTIVAILAGIVIPKLAGVITGVKASAIVANLGTISDNLRLYQIDSASFPPTAAMGQVPPALKLVLGDNFPFVTTDYQLQYNNWQLSSTIAGDPSLNTIIGITVQTPDPLLGLAVLTRGSAWPHFQSGNNYTFILYGW